MGDDGIRRTIHDDILHEIHTTMLAPPADPAALQRRLGDIHARLAALLRQIPAAWRPDLKQLGLAGALKQSVEEFDRVEWEVDPEADRIARKLPPLIAETVFYAAREALRNAARHGRRARGPLVLRFQMLYEDGLKIIIEDNGPGLMAVSAARQTTGQGLSLHSALMAVAGGSLTAESEPDRFTRIRLQLPQSVLSELL